MHGKVSPIVYERTCETQNKVEIHVPRVRRAAGAGGDPEGVWEAYLRRTKQPPNTTKQPGESIAVCDAFHRRPAVQPGPKTSVASSRTAIASWDGAA